MSYTWSRECPINKYTAEQHPVRHTNNTEKAPDMVVQWGPAIWPKPASTAGRSL